jgi:hypothetical protein
MRVEWLLPANRGLNEVFKLLHNREAADMVRTLRRTTTRETSDVVLDWKSDDEDGLKRFPIRDVSEQRS